MFHLDDNFLEELGLGGMPEEQKRPFLQHIYEQLQDKVGMSLSEGMSEAQLEQFGDIIDHKQDVVNAWLSQNAPDFENDPIYQRLAQQAQASAPEGAVVNPDALRAEFAASRWLEINRPDYRDVVTNTLNAIKQEIMQSRSVLLGQSGEAPQA